MSQIKSFVYELDLIFPASTMQLSILATVKKRSAAEDLFLKKYAGLQDPGIFLRKKIYVRRRFDFHGAAL